MINKRRMERNIGTILSMGTFTFKKKRHGTDAV